MRSATPLMIAQKMAGHKLFGAKVCWNWYRDAQGRRVAYVGLDATGVAQQGDHGQQADGRMAYVGIVYNPLPDPERVALGRPHRHTSVWVSSGAVPTRTGRPGTGRRFTPQA